MLVRSRLSEQPAASLARALAQPVEPEQPETGDAPAVLPAAPRGGRLVWPFVTVLIGGLSAVAAISPTHAVTSRPGLLLLLVGCVVMLDLIRLDVFERIHLSPATVPALVLAFLFGPLGPIAAELAIAVMRLMRRVPVVKWAFDVGMLGLAGAAAAATWTGLGPHGVAGEALVGAGAGFVVYLATSVLLPSVLHLARGERAVAAWREQLAWLWPHYIGFGVLAAALVDVEHRLGPAGILLCAVPVVLLWIGEHQYLRRSRDGVIALREANERIRDLLEHAHASYLTAITTLGHALQAREPDGAGRTERVSQLARIIGDRMGMSATDLDALTVGVVVHELGRVCLRPRDDAARVPELSARLLEDLDVPQTVKDVARHHLERFDGLGTPDGLSGAAIPLPARIVAVADALDRLTTQTAARPAAALTRAVEHLRAESGTRFCPDVVTALDESLTADSTLRRYFGEHVGDVPFAA